MNNLVLCVKRDDLSFTRGGPVPTRGAFVFRYPEFFGSVDFWYVPRHIAEADDTYLQIIPYMMLEKGEFVFTYQRGPKGAEKRLEDKWSLGLGGHIGLRDVHLHLESEELNPVRTVYHAARRELLEEVGIDVRSHGFNWEYCIYDPSTPVGRVHLGLFARVDLNVHTHQFVFEHKVVEKGELTALSQLMAENTRFEPWSRAVLEHESRKLADLAR